jgi:hypothetical protein
MRLCVKNVTELDMKKKNETRFMLVLMVFVVLFHVLTPKKQKKKLRTLTEDKQSVSGVYEPFNYEIK